MRFIPNVEKERYDSFVIAHPQKSHFMQSWAWGELNRLTRGMTPYYVGLENDEGQLQAAALLLLRKPPLFPPYVYSPRGFVLDFEDRDLVKAMTEAVQTFCKELGVMFLKIDPDIEIHELDSKGCPIPEAPDRSFAVEMLKSMGYIHRGFNKGFEGRQPRHSFRIDLTGTEKEIRKRVTGNVIKNINKGQRNYPATIRLGTEEDIPELHRLITLTSERDDFFGYSEEYYRSFYRVLAERDMARLWIGSVNAAEVLESLKKQLSDTEMAITTYKKENLIKEAELTIARLQREITTFEGYAQQYPGDTNISAHLVVRYGAHAWAVHAGSAGIMNETFINNRVYWNKIMHEKEQGAEWLDQFGTVGDPEDSHLASLHAFKRQFGGRYVEFAGEFDLPIRPFWYRLYEETLPKYRAFRFTIKEKLRAMRGR